MGLIDPNIVLQNNPNALGQGLQRGMGLIQQVQQFQEQRDDRRRTDLARLAFAKAAQGEDITKPEGMGRAIQKFAQAGFPNEASAVLAAHKDMFPQTEYTPVDLGRSGYASFDPRKGTFTPTQNPTTGKPFYSKEGEKLVEHDQKLAAFQNDLKTNFGPRAASLGDDVNKRNQLVSEIYTKYGDLPEAQKFVDDTKNTQPMLNGYSGAKLIGSYLSDFSKVKKDYETVARPYLAIQGIKNSKAWGTGVGDQSLIDKIILLETGKVPTEAQYFQFANNLGFADKVDKVTGRLKTGAILGDDARQRMLDEAEEQMKIAHDGFDKSMEDQASIMTAAGVNPKTVVRAGGFYNETKKALEKSAAGKAAPAAVKPHPQDSEAVQWAKAHPNDPRSAVILKANGF